MKEEVIIITGAGKGIGFGIAEYFAQFGCKVVIATKEIGSGKEAEKEILKNGGTAKFIQTDVSDEESIINMISETTKYFGKISTLINNAGITLFKPMHEVNIEDWEEVINIDLRGTFLCSKYASIEMKKNNQGSIINISSNHAIATLPNTEIYAAAKGGVNSMTKSMALSLGDNNIRVNAICPGFTDTPHHQEWLHSLNVSMDVEEKIKALHATKRISQPKDIAKLSYYLASDAAEMITGASFTIDGGVSSRLYYSDEF